MNGFSVISHLANDGTGSAPALALWGDYKI